MSGTVSKEWPHLEMGVSYLLAHNCKPAKLINEYAFCQGKCRLIYQNDRESDIWQSK